MCCAERALCVDLVDFPSPTFDKEEVYFAVQVTRFTVKKSVLFVSVCQDAQSVCQDAQINIYSFL